MQRAVTFLSEVGTSPGSKSVRQPLDIRTKEVGFVQRFRAWLRQGKRARKFVEGYTPISELMPDDVVIVGYPKSGNTWFQELISAVVHGVSPAHAPPALQQILVPDMHKQLFYKRFGARMFFKSHHLPRSEYRNVVYLLRDGRDAMVSFYHYLAAYQSKVNLLDLVQTARDIPQGKWHAHVNAWLENPYKARMLVIKYEDTKKDAVTELGRLCAFLGLERERDHLEVAARECDFQKMQKKEIAQGDGRSFWPKDKLFRRRGVVGSHKDEMPSEVLEAFMAEAGETLKKCGYIA
jgi:hypothetical protein